LIRDDFESGQPDDPADGWRRLQLIKLAVMGEVKSYFRPEFINRIDEVVVFPRRLTRSTSNRLRKYQLGHLEKRLLRWTQTGSGRWRIGRTGHVGFDPVFGARPLKPRIQATIEIRWLRKSSKDGSLPRM